MTIVLRASSWRAAYRWQAECAAVPWLHRGLLSAALAGMMGMAGWGRPWWLVVPLVVVWPGLFVWGVCGDVRAAAR